jgi:hypothetical protein
MHNQLLQAFPGFLCMYSSLLSAWDLHVTQSSSPACHLLLTESGGAHYHYHYCYLQKVLIWVKSRYIAHAGIAGKLWGGVGS